MGRDRQFRAGLFARLYSAFTQDLNLGVDGVEGKFNPEHFPDERAYGFPPNLMHDTDSHSSDIADKVDKLTRAAALALNGKLMRADIVVAGGHTHAENYLSELQWINFGRWRPLGDVQGTGGPVQSRGLLYVTNTASGGGPALTVHVPSHIKEVELWVRAALPAPSSPGTPDGWLHIDLNVYDGNAGAPFAAPKQTSQLSLLSVAAGIQHPNRWLGPWLINVSTFTATRGLYWLACTVEPWVEVAGTIGGLWEVAIRRRSRGLY